MGDIRAYFMEQFRDVRHRPTDDKILALYKYQYEQNPIYKQFCDTIGKKPNRIKNVSEIPHLPITVFKNQEVKTGLWDSQEIFLSSGTTEQTLRSRHHVRDVSLYLRNAETIWRHHFGSLQNTAILALLPGYLERDGSSLIHMVHHFIRISHIPESGFYLYDHEALYQRLKHCQTKGMDTVLFGVSYALLDFVETYKLDFPTLKIFETGGMKGKRKEMTKDTLHQILISGFGVPKIYSEYGMTELLSQCYSDGYGKFVMNGRLWISISQVNDPFTPEKRFKAGVINVMDFCNVDSCAFIQTQDIGRMGEESTFEVLGRLDYADLRGCNLLVSDL
jgi:phenylacetate-coenzyme A ligase PaaK-like adenylate-forming protein